MTSPLTITFSNTSSSSVLQSFFLPEITLEEDYNYSCAFLDLIIIKNKTKNTPISYKPFDDDINKIDLIHVNCDVISGSYINGERRHVIHQFAPNTSYMKGRIFAEIPKNLNYFPIKFKNLRSIQISIVDLNGKPLDIKDINLITCRINIKKDSISEKHTTC